MAQFEKLVVWQRAYDLSVSVDRAARGMPAHAALQLRRSAASIPDNIAEGSARGTTRQFVYFLDIASGSCAEAQSQLRRAHACGYMERTTFLELIDAAQPIGWMLLALRRRWA